MRIEQQAHDRIECMSRQAKRFMGGSPPFDAALDYESDVDGLVTCTPAWVSSEKDLTDLGREVRRQLLEAGQEL